jgi:hypothetical protein
MTLHLELGAAVDAAFNADLDSPVEQKQDVLTIRLKNGVALDVRYAAPDAYSLRWTYGEAECGIDTAPLHGHLATFPNHFHDPAGRVVADPVTSPAAAPRENLEKLIGALLADPLLGVRERA